MNTTQGDGFSGVDRRSVESVESNSSPTSNTSSQGRSVPYSATTVEMLQEITLELTPPITHLKLMEHMLRYQPAYVMRYLPILQREISNLELTLSNLRQLQRNNQQPSVFLNQKTISTLIGWRRFLRLVPLVKLLIGPLEIADS